jgi:hypothetical protein
MGTDRVFVGLLAEFVRGKMIFLAMRDSSRGMGVGGKVMEFSGSLVCSFWHSGSRLRYCSGCGVALPLAQLGGSLFDVLCKHRVVIATTPLYM